MCGAHDSVMSGSNGAQGGGEVLSILQCVCCGGLCNAAHLAARIGTDAHLCLQCHKGACDAAALEEDEVRLGEEGGDNEEGSDTLALEEAADAALWADAMDGWGGSDAGSSFVCVGESALSVGIEDQGDGGGNEGGHGLGW